MKKLFLILSLFSLALFSQISEDEKEEMERKFGGFGKADRLHIQFFNDIWMKLPDSGDYKTYNPGFNTYILLEKKFGSSPFSVAGGLGVSAHNFNFQAEMRKDSNDVVEFHPFAEKKDKYKLVLSYVDIPVEFRYRSKGKNVFRFYIGGKFGLMVGNHTKMIDEGLKIKSYNISNLLPFRYGLTMTVGYKLFNVFAFYSLSPLFEKNKGPQMYPISIGISIIPF
ncbi:MAG: PorT family protein [Bacteroidales bacterium]|nr:PorT family protein [Bacteroidales bacterium]